MEEKASQLDSVPGNGFEPLHWKKSRGERSLSAISLLYVISTQILSQLSFLKFVEQGFLKWGFQASGGPQLSIKWSQITCKL